MKFDAFAIVNKIKENIITVIILAVAFIVAVNVAKSKQKLLVQLQAKQAEELKKNKKIDDILVWEKKIDSLSKVVNVKSIESEQVLGMLRKLAERAQVKIALFNAKGTVPVPGTGFTRFSFEMTLSAANYHLIARFVDSIEHSPHIFFVETLAISGSRVQKKEEGISATMTISTVLIEEKK